jgi:hypothetical protein
MDNKEYNEKAINDVYKNAHIALQSISDILPSVDDEGLKVELKEQYEGYERVIGEISTFMAENNITPKDVNPLKKAMLWSSIKMKTMFDNSKNQIAEMMIKGTVMGITELTAMKNEGENLSEGVLEKVILLLELEENYNERLKKYL